MSGRRSLRGRQHSLQSRYLLIIIAALLFIPVGIPLTFAGYNLFNLQTAEKPPEEYKLYSNITALEEQWHQEASGLSGQTPDDIDRRLEELSGSYPLAAMFWVDGEGQTRQIHIPEDPQLQGQLALDRIPAQWSAPEAIAFMKDAARQDPLAIVAFIGDRADAGEGFLVMQIPEKITEAYRFQSLGSWYILVLLIFFALFVAVSWLFFTGIRRRLLRLQTAMSFTGGVGIPEPIAPGKADEIGRLEEAFNHMVAELTVSRRREAEEEGLRKRLVADLSHDLRTPLTVIRSHLHVLGKEGLSRRGQESIQLMDERIEGLSGLIDNLLSYNLLSSGRVTLNPERKDVLRILRESAAAWYPLWEKEGFEVDISLEGEPLYWVIDESWFRRILDNLFQNIVRHARSGKYVGVQTVTRGDGRAVVISDRGQGMDSAPEAAGAGLGLSIVDLLLKRMELVRETDSSPQGTSIEITQPRTQNLNKI
ncbi:MULTISPECIES: HAMP domain-containing sensor histidine kinase [unclassified Paenibacillus]|uniref:sensor histidine kinase n=1 Tax=unclassified Paenibacillus TaxID=185978 RepID=UPI002405C5AE|nr:MULTISPECIES: HAMP domain-containing sensor histidine kinase [unclassified Paenibacillus]MDF9840948.1 signal transduction histidine kinase [Paenibacillus sp. PastF-2]MDF9847532.1 signal transduction histidine kinase [Paenibacillus sp. PastM-2]MDF9853892.1 signal transduction histidine kinase [Paenibacillus sp. PastF-1]MDH6479163.1 signal transduction histidine kinase [Paenibacillus sp. PastH-2]MDH6507100.1 signal transduction histidine kinase [Paenibacillus sp. PastM-3]